MEFKILGPLEVLVDGRPLELGGAKQRALLTVLLLHANEVVSSDRLIDALWEEEAPETGRKALQVYVSQLRKAIGKERLVTQAPGYLLRVEPEELDLDRFRMLVASGQPEAALSLWRGPALAEFAYQRFAQPEIAQLEELRLNCVESRIEAELAAGRHTGVIGELEALVSENPLRERLRAQLMLALYRAGRQAEALEAFQDVRRALVDELGIDPSRQLRELESAILRQDPALEARSSPTPNPAAVEPTEAPLPEPQVSVAAPREARKTVTALVARITLFSPDGSRLDPEVLRGVSRRAFGEVENAIERHGGTIQAIAGDAVSAVFGLPRVHEDDALRALRAASEAREQLLCVAAEIEASSPARLDARIGVSTGEVFTGADVGSSLTPTGEPLTVSASLAHMGEPGEVLLDEATRRVVRDAVVVEELVEAPGHRLVEVASAERGYSSRFSSPMVGRARERRRLNDAFEQALTDDSCQLFTILGSAGVGKSRLVREFLADVERRAQVARGRCLSYGEGITYWPVLEAVKDAVGIGDTDTPEECVAKLKWVFAEESEVEIATQQLASVLGLGVAAGATEESFWAVRLFFEVVARKQPLVLVFDDVHWGEPTFLDLLDHLSDWMRDAPILLVCIARPELLDTRPEWGGGKLNSTSVLLEPLSDVESVQLVENLAGSGFLRDTSRQRIVEAADGNPLFVEEMLALLLEDGDLATAFETPPTIQALLAARLDRLGYDERAAIEAAAIEGKVFHASSVTELTGVATRSAERELLTLVRKELVRPDRSLFAGDKAFRFRHLLIRDAAYDSIPKERRATLHQRHADWLERKVEDRAPEFDEVLGYHLERAHRYRMELGAVNGEHDELALRAGRRLGAAGRRALARGDTPAALNLVSRAAAILPRDDPARLDLVPGLRIVQGLGDQLAWAEEVLSDAIATGDSRVQAHARVQQALLQLFTGSDVEVDQLVDTAENAIGTFEELHDDLGLSRSWRLLQQARYLGRQAAASADAAENALAHARRAEDALEELEIMTWLGIALYMGSTPAAEAAARVNVHLAQARTSRTTESLLLSCLAPLEAMQGRVSEARELIARAQVVVDDLGYLAQLALVPFHAGVTELLAGDPAAAEHAFRASLAPLEEIGETSNYCSIVAGLAQAVYLQERYEEADELTRVSERLARTNDIHAQVTWRSVRVKALARQGHISEALALAAEAISFAEASDFLNAHGEALLDLAEVLAMADRPTDGFQAVEAALRLFERKGNVVGVARSGTLLAGIS
ncbi:MAG: AAA family ATPase [Actinobacteria bacterium]|nr:AAA family ATPase [Actinomycetota bacterium]